jgi:sec-independent protein translocase protein TatC
VPIVAKRMPFFSHFAELRKRATVCLVVVVVLAVAFYVWSYEFIMNLLFQPIVKFLPPDSQQMVFTGPFEAMTFRFQVGLYGAVIAASPLILYQIFAFFAPALKKRERKWVYPTIFTAIVLFLLGVLFAYIIIVPAAFEFLVDQNTELTVILPIAQQWLSGVGMMLLGFGISFELPLVVFYLIGLGVLPYQRVRESWRVAYVIITVIAAIATPDWSPYPMFGLSAALIILFEGSLFAARIVFWRRIAEQAIDAYEDQRLYDDEVTEDPEILKRREKVVARAEAARKRLKKEPKPDDKER